MSRNREEKSKHKQVSMLLLKRGGAKDKKGHFAAPMGQGVSVFNICKDATQHANASVVETHMEQKTWL